MSVDTAKVAIKTRFNTMAESSHPDVPRFGPNRSPGADITEPWWALDVVDGKPIQINVDPVQWRRIGFVYVQIFVPVNSGDKVLEELKKRATEIFEGAEFSTTDSRVVKCRGAEPIPAGSARTGGRYEQVNVVTEFHQDDP